MYKTLRPILMLSLFFCLACQNDTTPLTDAAYQNEMEEWRNERISELKQANGWLSLVGLLKLKEGENTFGSAPENKVVFPENAPAKMGAFYVTADSVYIKIAENVPIRIKDSIIQEATLSPKDPVLLEYASLNWHLIERGGQYFIRLRDTLTPARQELTSVPYFPVDPKWRVRAKFIPFDPPKTIPVHNVLDMDIDYHCDGKLQFEAEGQTHEIWVLDGGPEDYFLIFADLTTGDETYGGGRYLYAPRPDSEGYTTIDFNKAYNPPCVFTKYATCLLPPVQNRLEVAIRAGEVVEAGHLNPHQSN